MKNLSNNKACGLSEVSNEMLRYAESETINESLAYIYESMINSVTTPKLFNISILKLLIKDKNKSPSDVNNLRPLSISNVYSSIYEQIILQEIRKEHVDHEKQFGFKADSSCSHAVFILNEMIKLNQSIKTHTCIISIDASKAFDRVVRDKLWLLMLEMNFNPTLVLSIKNYYKQFHIIIQNDQEFSSLIPTTEGVKQGGSISPDLYKIYTEEIAITISSQPIGINIGKLIVDLIM